jgi:hypothetical protein
MGVKVSSGNKEDPVPFNDIPAVAATQKVVVPLAVVNQSSVLQARLLLCVLSHVEAEAVRMRLTDIA